MTDNDKNLILPGTAAFQEALKGADGVTALSATFTNETLRGQTGMRWVHIPLTEVVGKLVIHITRCSRPDMERLSPMLRSTVAEMNIVGSSAEAGPSPLFPKQYDFVLLDIPTIQMEAVTRLILGRVRDIFRS